MATKVRGITIEIGGDTSGLSKALNNVNKEINTTSRDLRDVERLLKLDPKNTELLAQKQRLLNKQFDASQQKLKSLRQAAKEVSKNLDTEDARRQYEALQREIVATENSMANLGKEAKATNATFKDVFSAGALIEGAKGIVSGIKDISEESKELALDLSKLDQNARDHGVAIDSVRDTYKEFAAQTMETDSAIEATSNLLQAGFTESNLQKAVEGLSGAALKFPDTLKIESLADSLQETIATGAATGQFAELIERLGINLDGFNAEMAQATTLADKQNLVLRTLADEGLNETYEEWLKNNEAIVESNEATLSLQEQLAELGEVMTPIFTEVTKIVSEVVEWFNTLDDDTQRLVLTVVALVAGVGALLPVFTGITSALTLFTNPAGLVVVAIGAITAAIIWLWDNCEEFRDFFLDLGKKLVSAFEAVGDFFVNLFGKTIPNAFISFINFFIKGINMLIEGLNSFSVKLPDWLPDWLGGGKTFGFDIATIPEIPMLAAGGVLSQGSAIVGEAGPELLTMSAGRAIVQPLTGGTTNNAYSTANTINVTVNGIHQLDEIVRWYTNQRQVGRAGG